MNMQKLRLLEKGQIYGISVEEVVRLGTAMKYKKRKGIIEELAGKYRNVGQRMAREGKTSVNLVREARNEIWKSGNSL